MATLEAPLNDRKATDPTPPTITNPLPATFTAIAPEIRNHIYELALTTSDPDTEVNLLEAEPPSKALLLTCRQVYDEVKHM